MKNKFIFFFAAIAFCSVTLIMGCKKEDVSATYVNKGYYIFSGNGSAARLIPAPVAASTGTAQFFGVYDINSQMFNYTVTWNGLTSNMTSANFYGPSDSTNTSIVTRNIATGQALSGVNYTLTGVIWNYSRLTDTELADLKNGKWYYTIITTNNTAGEVRGQIKLDSTITK